MDKKERTIRITINFPLNNILKNMGVYVIFAKQRFYKDD